MQFSFLARVNHGILEPQDLDYFLVILAGLEGQRVILKVDPDTKTDPQLGRYRKRILPAITAYHNRHLEPGELPKHETEMHHALARAFAGAEPVELKPRSTATLTKAEMSKMIDDIQAHYGDLGVSFDHQDDHP